MKNIILGLLTFSLFTCISAYSEDKKQEISKKESNQLIDIFSGKVEKKVPEKEVDDKRNQAANKDFARDRDDEIKKRMENMTKEERKKFKKEMERRRAEMMEKMKKMTPEQRKAYMRQLEENKKKRKR